MTQVILITSHAQIVLATDASMCTAAMDNAKGWLTMAEYIERESVERKLANIYMELGGYKTRDAFYKAIDLVHRYPAADVAPVRYGTWEWFEEWIPSTTEHPAECEDCGWQCGNCKMALEDMVGGYWDDPYERPQLAYCPNCGAKMNLEK